MAKFDTIADYRHSSLITDHFLIQPHQKDPAFRRFRVSSDLFRASPQVIFHSYSYPPRSGGTAESQHFGGVVASRKMVGNLARPVLALEASQLNCPTAAGFDRLRRLQHFNSHPASAFLYQTDLFRRGLRKVNNSSFNERSSVMIPHPPR